MKIKTSDLSGAALDWAVAKCGGIETRNTWLVQYIPQWAESDDPFGFECFADDAAHAVEQCDNAYPNCTIVDYEKLPEFHPSTNWSQGGPIIERECITISALYAQKNPPSPEYAHGEWGAYIPCGINSEAAGRGPTPLIAAMRCCVANTLGDEVEVPKELHE